MTKTFIAYTRVSTLRQGIDGVSLDEQRRSIASYAELRSLNVAAWYEEKQTAARSNRPVFLSLVELLNAEAGNVGLLLYKIDRGARNLRDWAAIGELIDNGVDVRFVADDLDMNSRGGHLAADIQAVIAADYIRNLREEVLKGIRGRLNQGLYPFPAPRGYRNRGRAQVKSPCPVAAPLVIAAFQLYATGRYSLHELAREMAVRGLTTLNQQALRPSAMSKLLRNPFYIGNAMVRGEIYRGIHQPLVTSELFDTVQRVLKARKPWRRRRHHFQYSKRLQCRLCERFLIGELQKGRVYYRCHVCRGVSVREDRILAEKGCSGTFWTLATLEKPMLEPYEKFDSPPGIDTVAEMYGNKGLD